MSLARDAPASDAPDAPTPIPLPDGSGETLVACRGCGVGILPRNRLHAWCSDACRWAHKPRAERDPERLRAASAASHRRHASYRMARRVLTSAGLDPDTVPALACLRGRGHVPGWRTIVDSVADARSRADRARGRWSDGPPDPPWEAAVGDQPAHYAWGSRITLPGSPPPRHLHGMLSGALAEPHAQTARWSLVPLSRAEGAAPGREWAVLWHRETDAARLAQTTHPVHVRGEASTLSLGPLTRLRTPAAPAPGLYRVAVDAVTPVTHGVDGRSRAVVTPTTATVLSALGETLSRTGLTTGRLHVAEVDAATQRQHHDLGGHVGEVVGWVGRIVVTCNAPAAWALLLCRSLGFGGRVAFGLGRVHVEVLP